MISREAPAHAEAADRLDRRLFHLRMLAQIEIIVAGEGQEPLAVADDGNAVLARGLGQAAAQLPGFERCQFFGGETIERGQG